MARAHDHVCEVCHLPCSGAGILKDSRDRYFHRECYQHAVARKGMKGNIAPSRAVGTKPGGEPQWRVGDHVSCTHPKCNASFRIATAEVAAAGSLACPRCKSPLKRTTAQPTDVKPKPSAEVRDILGEVEPPPRQWKVCTSDTSLDLPDRSMPNGQIIGTSPAYIAADRSSEESDVTARGGNQRSNGSELMESITSRFDWPWKKDKCPNCARRLARRYVDGSFSGKSSGPGTVIVRRISWKASLHCITCQAEECMVASCKDRATHRLTHVFIPGFHFSAVLRNDLWLCQDHCRIVTAARVLYVLLAPVFVCGLFPTIWRTIAGTLSNNAGDDSSSMSTAAGLFIASTALGMLTFTLLRPGLATLGLRKRTKFAPLITEPPNTWHDIGWLYSEQYRIPRIGPDLLWMICVGVSLAWYYRHQSGWPEGWFNWTLAISPGVAFALIVDVIRLCLYRALYLQREGGRNG